MCASTDASIAAGAFRTKVLAHFTVLSHPAWFAVATVVIDQLAAVCRAVAVARVGQAFIDVSLATRPGKSCWTFTFKAAHPIDTDTAMVASTLVTLVHVDLTKLATGARRARAGEPVNKIVAHSTVHTEAGLAVVDVVLALCTHEARRAAAAVLRLEIVAGSPIEAGVHGARVRLELTVGAPVAVPTLACVRGANIAALASVLAQPRHGSVAVVGCYLAAHHLHITELAGPARGAGAPVTGPVLYAGTAALAGAARTPVYKLVTVNAGKAGLAETLVGAVDTLAGGTVLARPTVASVYPALAVGAGEALFAEAGVVVDTVLAEAAVHAGAQRAVLVICLAVNPTETQRAGTRKGVDIVCALSAVLTGIGAALVLVFLTIFAHKARHAETLVISCLVQACAAIQARIAGTVVGVNKTVPPFKTFLALARVAAISVKTRGAVPARRGDCALIDILSTVAPRESNRTGAGEVFVV
jgi:hypothetical protein